MVYSFCLFTDWTSCLTCLTQKNIKSKSKKNGTSACLLSDKQTTWVNIIVELCHQIGGHVFTGYRWKLKTFWSKGRRVYLQSNRLCFCGTCSSRVHVWEDTQIPLKEHITWRWDEMTQFMELFTKNHCIFLGLTIQESICCYLSWNTQNNQKQTTTPKHEL